MSNNINQKTDNLDLAYKRFRKKAIKLAIEDGYLKNSHEARKYELWDNGTFKLLGSFNSWFKVGTNLNEFYY